MAKSQRGDSPATFVLGGVGVLAIWAIYWAVSGGDVWTGRDVLWLAIGGPAGVLMIVIGIVKWARRPPA